MADFKFIQILCVLFLFGNFIVEAYELKLDVDRETILWKFRGHYLYTPKGQDLDGILNVGAEEGSRLPAALKEDGLSGVWLTKYSSAPFRENKLVISYTLKHALFTQGWIRFVAHPNTSMLVKTNNEKKLGRYWSDGESWCDAVINMGLQTMIILEIETPDPSAYFLLDKVILGIFSNVSALNGRTLNSCFLEPQTRTQTHPTTSSLTTIIHPSNSSMTKTIQTQEVHNETIGSAMGERRNTRESGNGSGNGEEVEESSSSSSTTSPPGLNDLIELRTETTTTGIDTRRGEEEKWNDEEDVIRITPLTKPPTNKKRPKKRLRLQLRSPGFLLQDNSTSSMAGKSGDLMDSLDTELPSSDGSSTNNGNHKNQPMLDLKCECSCSCKNP